MNVFFSTMSTFILSGIGQTDALTDAEMDADVDVESSALKKTTRSIDLYITTCWYLLVCWVYWDILDTVWV
jgi:hypothetical protein